MDDQAPAGSYRAGMGKWRIALKLNLRIKTAGGNHGGKRKDETGEDFVNTIARRSFRREFELLI